MTKTVKKASNSLKSVTSLESVHASPFTVHATTETVHASSFTIHATTETVHASPFAVHATTEPDHTSFLKEDVTFSTAFS